MTFTLHYESDQELENKLMVILSSLQKWMTCQEVQNKYGINSPNKLCNRLKRFKGEFEAERGPSGRILRTKVSPSLHAYLEKLGP